MIGVTDGTIAHRRAVGPRGPGMLPWCAPATRRPDGFRARRRPSLHHRGPGADLPVPVQQRDVRPSEVQTPPGPAPTACGWSTSTCAAAGSSTGNAADLTFDVLAQDLEAVRGHLGLDGWRCWATRCWASRPSNTAAAVRAPSRTSSRWAPRPAATWPPCRPAPTPSSSRTPPRSASASCARTWPPCRPDAHPWAGHARPEPDALSRPALRRRPAVRRGQIRPEMLMHLFGIADARLGRDRRCTGT